MQLAKNKLPALFDVSKDDMLAVIRGKKMTFLSTNTVLFLVGTLLTPVTLLGAMWGYIRSYNVLFRDKDIEPTLDPLLPVQRKAMVIGGIAVWGVLLGFFLFLAIMGRGFIGSLSWLLVLFSINIVLTIGFLLGFKGWRNSKSKEILADESERFGTARFADPEELADLTMNKGLYIGNLNYAYAKQGHLLSVAGTRGGKGVNLIIPNLLGQTDYDGSFFVIDPKGENAAITARYQRSIDRDVHILDPWGLQTTPDTVSSYNPLNLITGKEDNEHLSDDAGIIAEMIVPGSDKGDQFFNDRARSLISGLLMHLVLTEENPSLAKIWEWLRLSDTPFNNLIADMATSDNFIVKATGCEVMNIMIKSDKTFGSILSTAQQYTDFLKSPALQKSLETSSFDINQLSDGNTTLYVIIPADKLVSHYQWLRLVVTTALRAVIRNKNNRVTFILDEFAALGYISEIRTALSTYAGFNVTIWPILQSLIQLKDKYGND